MAWAVGNEPNERATRTSVWQDAIQGIAYKLDHSEIGALAVSYKVVLFSWEAAISQHNQSSCMFLDNQPDITVQAAAINCHRFAFENVAYSSRLEIIRDLI